MLLNVRVVTMRWLPARLRTRRIQRASELLARDLHGGGSAVAANGDLQRTRRTLARVTGQQTHVSSARERLVADLPMSPLAQSHRRADRVLSVAAAATAAMATAVAQLLTFYVTLERLRAGNLRRLAAAATGLPHDQHAGGTGRRVAERGTVVAAGQQLVADLVTGGRRLLAGDRVLCDERRGRRVRFLPQKQVRGGWLGQGGQGPSWHGRGHVWCPQARGRPQMRPQEYEAPSASLQGTSRSSEPQKHFWWIVSRQGGHDPE